MLQPVSAFSLCTCCWPYLILKEPRVPEALPLTACVLELFPGGAVLYYIPFKHSKEEHRQTYGSIC